MKNLLVMFALVCSGSIECAQPLKNDQQEQQPGEKQTQSHNNKPTVDEDKACMQRVIGTFARIAQSFFNIASAQDPKDPIILGQNLTEMAAGVIKIAMEMFRSPYCIDDENQQPSSFVVTDEDIALIRHIIADMKEQLSHIDVGTDRA